MYVILARNISDSTANLRILAIDQKQLKKPKNPFQTMISQISLFKPKKILQT